MRLRLECARPIHTNKQCDCNEFLAMNNRHLQTEEPRLDRKLNESAEAQRALPVDAYEAGVDYLELLFGEQIPYSSMVPYSREKVVAIKPPSKRKVYRNALNTLYHRPLTARDAALKMFVKNERMNIGEDGAYKPPRAIQARSPRYNLTLQQYLIPIERWLFHRGNTKRVVAKGLDGYSKAKFFVKLGKSSPILLLSWLTTIALTVGRIQPGLKLKSTST